MNKKYNVAVVGAGIVGLAVAYAAARRGKTVAVFERNARAQGASIRNFGLIWPLGQPAGDRLEMALQSRSIWLDLAEKTGLHIRQDGSLTLAYYPDEAAVLEEFMSGAKDGGYDCELLSRQQIADRFPNIKTEGLLLGLYSKTECTVSPRTGLPLIARYLEEQYGVDFYWNCGITHTDSDYLTDFYDMWQAEQIYICSGYDFETLYPKVFKENPIVKCKLQMMRTAPQPPDWQLGPALCAGLTLRHYDNFAHCPSLKLVSDRYDAANPFFRDMGIHVLLSQNETGALIIGDSHEYGNNPSPFDRQDINRQILDYLDTFATYPVTSIEEAWHGIYAKMPGQPFFVLEAEPNVWIINGLGGAGMTLSFGLADQLLPLKTM